MRIPSRNLEPFGCGLNFFDRPKAITKHKIKYDRVETIALLPFLTLYPRYPPPAFRLALPSAPPPSAPRPATLGPLCWTSVAGSLCSLRGHLSTFHLPSQSLLLHHWHVRSLRLRMTGGWTGAEPDAGNLGPDVISS